MTEVQTISAVVAMARDLTITGTLVLFIFASYRGMLIWRHHHAEVIVAMNATLAEALRRELEAARREAWWQRYALSLLDVTNAAVKVAEAAPKTLP